MARKNFATPVEESIQNDFKIECRKQGYKQNEVIEALMTGFINGEIKIRKEISYKIIIWKFIEKVVVSRT